MNPTNPTNSTRPFVSIVIPAFNEAAIIEKNLGILCDYMATLEDKYRWEIIIVNDGSTDETGDLAESCAKKRQNIYVLHHMYNFRMGQALRYAFNHCKGDYIVTYDLDLSYSPDHIKRLIDKIAASRAKIVIASPYMQGGQVSNVPFFRKILSVWANRFLSFFAKDRFLSKLTTLTGMVRAYDRKFLSALNLKAMDMDINPEIIYKAMILRARIVEIPAHLCWSMEKASRKPGEKRKSSIRILRNILSSLLAGFIFRPFMFFVLPGFVLMLVAFYPLGWVLIHTISYYYTLPASAMPWSYQISDAVAAAYKLSPHAFIVGGIAFMVSIQLISLGILALQNKRYFEELFHLGSMTKKRSIL